MIGMGAHDVMTISAINYDQTTTPTRDSTIFNISLDLPPTWPTKNVCIYVLLCYTHMYMYTPWCTGNNNFFSWQKRYSISNISYDTLEDTREYPVRHPLLPPSSIVQIAPVNKHPPSVLYWKS